MRFRTSAAVAGTIVAVGLSVGGCKPQTTQAAASSTTTATATSAAADTATASSGTGGDTGTSGGDCQAADLSFTLGAKSGSNQVTQVVDLTNKGSSSCTMDGFPGVDIIGYAQGQTNYRWSLVRQNVSAAAVTLAPGGTAHFDVMYLPADASSDPSDITATMLEVTPPNTYTSANVTFTASIMLQDGATHPGTYISPIASGS